MADYEETVTTPSQNIVSSQTGDILIDEAQGRLIISKNGVRTLYIDGEGLHMIRSGVEQLRLGVRPDDVLDLFITKNGVSIDSIFS